MLLPLSLIYYTVGEDNSDLFLEEKEAELELVKREQMSYMASVPGLLRPYDALADEDPDI